MFMFPAEALAQVTKGSGFIKCPLQDRLNLKDALKGAANRQSSMP
jgi:hypothetical protein